MQLFFNPNVSDSHAIINFDKDESRHISKVLRKKVGDILYLTNGKGWLFTSKLISVEQKYCSANIVSKVFHKKRGYKLHLAVAPTKMNDRFECFLEKATEIGVDTITPILCDRSERKVIKTERFEKIIQSAMKQSLQYYLPELKPLTTFSDFVNQDFEGQKFIAHCEDTKRKSLKSQIKKGINITILIGPEGDFSTKEIEKAIAENFIPVVMGETRLRTETAAIAACHSVNFINK